MEAFSTQDLQPIYDYIYDKVGGSTELFLEQNEIARTIWLAMRIDGEIKNGGVAQLFFNHRQGFDPNQYLIVLELIKATKQRELIADFFVYLFASDRRKKRFYEEAYFGSGMTVAIRKLSNKLSNTYYTLAPSVEEKIIEYFNQNSNDTEFKALLTKINFKINKKNESQLLEALIAAIENGNLTLTKKLVTQVSSLDQADKWGNAPLIRTAYASSNRVEIAKILVDAGADINFVHKDNTPLYMALGTDNTDGYIEALLDLGADTEWENTLGMTPIFAAGEKKGGVAAMIHGGANIHHIESRGNSVLNWFLGKYSSWFGNEYSKEYHPILKVNIKLLLKNGVQLSPEGVYPLPKNNFSLPETELSKIVSDDLFLTDLLSFNAVRNSADFNSKFTGWSAVFEASYAGHFNALKALIKAGASLNSCLAFAHCEKEIYSGASVVDVAKNKKIRELLITHGATEGTRTGYTVVMETRGDWDSIKPILKKYVNKEDEELKTIWNKTRKIKGEAIEEVIIREADPNDMWDFADYKYFVLHTLIVSKLPNLQEAELLKSELEKAKAEVTII